MDGTRHTDLDSRPAAPDNAAHDPEASAAARPVIPAFAAGLSAHTSRDAEHAPIPLDTDYALSDNLSRTSGRIFLTGTQALVRMLLTQHRLDRAAGLNTAGFVSGYRGSPLGGVDMALWRAKKALDAENITFVPAINEDMAATALMGTQQAGMRQDRTVDGVFGMWYGKGPGVDRAGDALHHGHAAGASRHGGVLVVVGDDHTAVSSSIPHASEPSLIGWQMPILNPSTVAEYETYGLYGWALSRYAGAWVAFKALSETIESGRGFDVSPPAQFAMPPAADADDLEYGARDFLSLAIEARIDRRMLAVAEFARTHSIDTLVRAAPAARMGLITVGKAHLDVMELVARAGLDDAEGADALRIYRPGLTWPLDRDRLLAFAEGLDHIMVVEEKGAVVEMQVKEMLFNRATRPTVVGKRDMDGAGLIPSAGQLRPSLLAAPLLRWIAAHGGADRLAHLAAFTCPESLNNDADGMRRKPYFCSGCPHNTSTKVPEGSQAQSGVGCHYMAAWMDRDTGGLTQMGGEGVDWVGLSRYTTMPHVFQNMGEGTYFHSGYLAIRQAVAANATITYKILFNDAVAMTGGQPVDGPISVPQISRQMASEGVKRVVVTSDEPEKYAGVEMGAGVVVHHRRELDRLQRELREIAGVTILIHDQTCAAEKRRRRKKNAYPDPARRLAINTAVCEGCGDCGVQSNCLSVVPVETPYGRKRAIDQSSCNKDYSCVDGFCPSFVSVMGGAPRKTAAPQAERTRLADAIAGLPLPAPASQDGVYSLLVAGMGGTGVITIGALVSMAAHLEGRSTSVLDLTGLAQKGGTVISHIRIGTAQEAPGPVRIDWQQADTAIMCDPVAAVSPESLGALRHGHTHVIANTYVAPLSEFTRNPDAAFRPESLLAKIRHAVGDAHAESLDAHQIAVALFGDSILSNIFLLGYAWQRGWVPVSHAALKLAIELNNVAVHKNTEAFDYGRLAAQQPEALASALRPAAQVVQLTIPESFDKRLARGIADLTRYQDAAYARRYEAIVRGVADRERAVHPGGALRLAPVVARELYRLMAYKDEYEVARLFTDGAFEAQLGAQFEGDYSLRFHMAPPLLSRKDPRTGVPRKMTFGPRMMPALRLLARFKRIRGTWLDPFGYTADRRTERAMIQTYVAAIETLCGKLDAARLSEAVRIASLAEKVRGYGHVKDKNILKFHEDLTRALQAYDMPHSPVEDLRKTA